MSSLGKSRKKLTYSLSNRPVNSATTSGRYSVYTFVWKQIFARSSTPSCSNFTVACHRWLPSNMSRTSVRYSSAPFFVVFSTKARPNSARYASYSPCVAGNHRWRQLTFPMSRIPDRSDFDSNETACGLTPRTARVFPVSFPEPRKTLKGINTPTLIHLRLQAENKHKKRYHWPRPPSSDFVTRCCLQISFNCSKGNSR